MNLTKTYKRTRFPAETLREAAAVLFAGLEGVPSVRLRVKVDEGEWVHETEEEFFADYRRSSEDAAFSSSLEGHGLWVRCSWDSLTTVEVEAPSRARIHETFEIFESKLDSSRLPEPLTPVAEPDPPPVVFIGHGRSSAWRDLKDHLQDKHGFEVEAYEIGARAGHAIRDVLQDMLSRSSFALLVMTGEDETADGELRARQNVIHEAGLFQGRLGFNRAIVLLEQGTEAFSNIQGIEQIRFSKGSIKETFGEVLATLRREFGNRAAEPTAAGRQYA